MAESPVEGCKGAPGDQSVTGGRKKNLRRLDFVSDPEYNLRLFNIAVRIGVAGLSGSLHSVQWVHRWRV
jgi:hypothetical protein